MEIRHAVERFFIGADNNVVFATPGTINHTANFYGFDFVCELSIEDVVDCISIAVSEWDLTIENAIETILDDLQYDRPCEG